MASSLSTILPRAAPTIQQTVGPFFLGIVVNYLLWGIQITQTYHYYKRYRESDAAWMKVAVGLLFVADVLNSISTTRASWVFMVEGWGDPDLVHKVLGWGVNLVSFTDTFIASIAHVFYCYMIWSFLRAPYRYICVAIILSLSALQLVAGLGQTIFMAHIHISLSQFNRIRTWIYMSVIPASVADIVITAIMARKLTTDPKSFKRGDSFVNKLVKSTVETGLATAVIQLADLVVYLASSGTTYHLVLTFIAPKVYSNSMLAVLNSRPETEPRWSQQVWEARKGSPGTGIQIHTAQTVIVTSDNELSNTLKGMKKGSRISR